MLLLISLRKNGPECGVPDNTPQSLLQQAFSRFHAVPRRSAGRMRQGDYIKAVSVTRYFELTADDLIEFLQRKELFDCQLPDGDNQGRPQNIQFALQPDERQ